LLLNPVKDFEIFSFFFLKEKKFVKI